MTLVELLAVIVIVALLAALLMPAVQRARESARRAQCSNNLKQLGLAVLGFESANGMLPYLGGNPVFPVDPQTYGIFPQILPLIEQQSLYDNIVAAASVNCQNNVWTNKTLVLPFLACPSDPADGPRSKNRTIQTYRVNWGDVMLNEGESWYRGPMSIPRVRSTKVAHVADGLTNTLLFSEGAIPNGRQGNPGGVAYNVAGWSRGDLQPPPATCLAAAATGTAWIQPSWINFDEAGGRRWAISHATHTGFFTILPPNSPNCSSFPPETPFFNTSTVFPTATSYHAEGVFATMCDGSTRFIANEIDAGDPNQSPGLTPPAGNTNNIKRYTGESKWGVWGALGTIKGGERSMHFE